VYSFDSCVEIIDILLTSLPNLVYVKAIFTGDPFKSNYVIEKDLISIETTKSVCLSEMMENL